MSTERGSFGLKLKDIGEAVTERRKHIRSQDDLKRASNLAQKEIEDLKAAEKKGLVVVRDGELVYTC